MLSAQQLLTLDEEDIRRLLLSIDRLEGIGDTEKLEALQRISHALRVVMLTVAGRCGPKKVAGQ